MHWKIYLIAVIIISVITFVLYAVDKAKAKKGSWRISEKTLLLFSLFLGAAGGLSAMIICRHKTNHWYFAVVNVLALILHVALFFVLFTM